MYNSDMSGQDKIAYTVNKVCAASQPLYQSLLRKAENLLKKTNCNNEKKLKMLEALQLAYQYSMMKAALTSPDYTYTVWQGRFIDESLLKGMNSPTKGWLTNLYGYYPGWEYPSLWEQDRSNKQADKLKKMIDSRCSAAETTVRANAKEFGALSLCDPHTDHLSDLLKTVDLIFELFSEVSPKLYLTPKPYGGQTAMLPNMTFEEYVEKFGTPDGKVKAECLKYFRNVFVIPWKSGRGGR